MLLLVDPLAIALEVDLRGGRGLAVQDHRLVLHDIGLFRFYQEVGEGLWGVGGERLGKLTQSQEIIIHCRGEAGVKNNAIIHWLIQHAECNVEALSAITTVYRIVHSTPGS